MLAFDNMSGDAGQACFSDGSAEDIVTDLSKMSGLTSIARNSSFACRGRSVDLRTVGHGLGVGHALEGSVRRTGQRVRTTAQLIDAATGSHLWAGRYHGDLADLFAVQDAVTLEIVEGAEGQGEPREEGGNRPPGHCQLAAPRSRPPDARPHALAGGDAVDRRARWSTAGRRSSSTPTTPRRSDFARSLKGSTGRLVGRSARGRGGALAGRPRSGGARRREGAVAKPRFRDRAVLERDLGFFERAIRGPGAGAGGPRQGRPADRGLTPALTPPPRLRSGRPRFRVGPGSDRPAG